MAISRDQPMRPALSDVLDVVNGNTSDIAEIEDAVSDITGALPLASYSAISTVADAIADEAETRRLADNALSALLPASDYSDESTVSDALAAESAARTSLAALLPSTDYSDESTVSDALAALASWYRKGRESVTVAASSSETVNVTYDMAFDASMICMTTHALDATSATDTDVSVTLDASNETGIEFTVTNASSDDPKTVTIGYFTIGV